MLEASEYDEGFISILKSNSLQTEDGGLYLEKLYSRENVSWLLNNIHHYFHDSECEINGSAILAMKVLVANCSDHAINIQKFYTILSRLFFRVMQAEIIGNVQDEIAFLQFASEYYSLELFFG